MGATLKAERHGRDPELLVALGRVIKAARRAKGMKAHDLAERLGTTQQAVSAWETGKVAITLPHLYHLAGTLNLPASSLLRHAERVMTASQVMKADGARLAETEDEAA